MTVYACNAPCFGTLTPVMAGLDAEFTGFQCEKCGKPFPVDVPKASLDFPESTSEYRPAAELPKTAHALRPVRPNDRTGGLDLFHATTFPADPYGGCVQVLRRLRAFGMIAPSSDARPEFADVVLDVLDDTGSIIYDYRISKRGLEYLRRTLQLRRDRSADERYAEWQAQRRS